MNPIIEKAFHAMVVVKEEVAPVSGAKVSAVG